MTEEEKEAADPSEPAATEEDSPDGSSHAPRLEILKGRPWIIDPGRRAKWSAPEFVSANAVDIRQIGDPVLHAPAKKPRLPHKELEALAARMFASMVAAHGIGIAAPQIGVPLRVAIIDVDEMGIVAVNPVIEWVSDEVEETSEGCLSVRGLYGMLERPLAARIAAEDIRGSRFTLLGDELGAQCMIHETQHLDGTLYVDKLRSRQDLHPVEPAAPGEPPRSVSGHTRAEMVASERGSGASGGRATDQAQQARASDPAQREGATSV